MAQALSVEPIETALWPQGDIRDPLGVWGARLGVTGLAGDDEIEVVIQVTANKRSAYVYTCYSVNISVLTAVGATALIGKCRLLTNWPDIDPTAGVQGYGTTRFANITIQNFTSPIGGISGEDTLVTPQDRFLLLFDPRASGGNVDIVSLSLVNQVNADTYAFEAYGYYWDRSVLQAPGGPRHPGAV